MSRTHRGEPVAPKSPGSRIAPTAAAGWLLGGLLVAGCTQVLGIDGTYALSGTGGGTVSSGGSGSGGGGTGGAGTGTGGTGGAGTGTGGTGGAGAGCVPGHYSGVFNGSHRPSVTFVGVPATVKTGTVSFDLQGSGNVLAVSAGVVDVQLTSLVLADAGTLSATLTGTFDCGTGRIVNGRLEGTIDVVSVISTGITGTWEGSVDGAGVFSGTWLERESAVSAADAGVPANCPNVSPASVPIGWGCGTWTALPQ